MHNNAFILQLLAKFLNEKLAEMHLTECVSSSAEELHLLFGKRFYLKIHFAASDTLFLNPEEIYFPKRGVINQFKQIWNTQLKAVKPFPLDRGFTFEYEDYSLHIQCFGRKNGAVLTQNNQVIAQFKTKLENQSYIVENKEITFNKSSKEFEKLNPFVHPEMISQLQKMQFFDLENQQAEWEKFILNISKSSFYISKTNDQFALSIYPNQNDLENYDSVLDAQNDFAKLVLAQQRFNDLKTNLLAEMKKQLKHQQKLISSSEIKLKKLSQSTNYKEYADILMANLHAISKETDSIELFNFYTNRDVTIPLKSDLSAQKNAERYYRKAKNSHLEVENVKSVLEKAKVLEISLTEKIKKIEQSTSTKELQPFENQKKRKKTDTNADSPPYRIFSYNDFEIWVGKNAQSNDKLLKLMHKNDVWLHARNVAGSHVLIKNKEAKRIDNSVLEYAASLAAKFSKNQHDSLAAVIYTEPKFVRKFKGANPGQVKVEREQVILVKPLT
ncbi:MAG: DUF814 domain-containing protein [Flavobacteriales bacterium]|nr:DUF814 domain-containing protein [Flavobacteriales bacterium]